MSGFQGPVATMLVFAVLAASLAFSLWLNGADWGLWLALFSVAVGGAGGIGVVPLLVPRYLSPRRTPAGEGDAEAFVEAAQPLRPDLPVLLGVGLDAGGMGGALAAARLADTRAFFVGGKDSATAVVLVMVALLGGVLLGGTVTALWRLLSVVARGARVPAPSRAAEVRSQAITAALGLLVIAAFLLTRQPELSRLISYSRDPQVPVRLEAVQRLAERKEPSAVAALVSGLRDTHPVVAVEAASALAGNRSPQTLTALKGYIARGAWPPELPFRLGEKGPPGELTSALVTAYKSRPWRKSLTFARLSDLDYRRRILSALAMGQTSQGRAFVRRVAEDRTDPASPVARELIRELIAARPEKPAPPAKAKPAAKARPKVVTQPKAPPTPPAVVTPTKKPTQAAPVVKAPVPQPPKMKQPRPPAKAKPVGAKVAPLTPAVKAKGPSKARPSIQPTPPRVIPPSKPSTAAAKQQPIPPKGAAKPKKPSPPSPTQAKPAVRRKAKVTPALAGRPRPRFPAKRERRGTEVQRRGPTSTEVAVQRIESGDFTPRFLRQVSSPALPRSLTHALAQAYRTAPWHRVVGREKDFIYRAALLEALGRGGSASQDFLLSVVGSGADTRLRLVGVKALARVGTTRAILPLRKQAARLARRDPESVPVGTQELRRVLLAAVAMIERRARREKGRAAPNEWVRKLTGLSAEDIASLMFDSKQPLPLRRAAARRLTQAEGDTAREAFLRALTTVNDADYEGGIQSIASAYFAAERDPEAVPALLAAARRGCVRALETLTIYEDRSIAGPLQDYLRSTQSGLVWQKAVRWLAGHRVDTAAPLIANGLRKLRSEYAARPSDRARLRGDIAVARMALARWARASDRSLLEGAARDLRMPVKARDAALEEYSRNRDTLPVRIKLLKPEAGSVVDSRGPITVVADLSGLSIAGKSESRAATAAIYRAQPTVFHLLIGGVALRAWVAEPIAEQGVPKPGGVPTTLTTGGQIGTYLAPGEYSLRLTASYGFAPPALRGTAFARSEDVPVRVQ